MPERRGGFRILGVPACPPSGIGPDDVQECVDFALHFVRLWMRSSSAAKTGWSEARGGIQEDLESAALLGVTLARRDWTPLRGVRFSTFLSRAVSWRILVALRESGRDRGVSLEVLREREGDFGDGGPPDPRPLLSEVEFRADVERLLAGLGERERDLVRGHYLEGIPLNRLAAELGIPYRTAKHLLARAREELRGMEWG